MNPNGPVEQFIYLLSIHQRKIYTYILTSVGRHAAAEELMQQTLLKMWQNFSHYTEGTNFCAWGKEIARYEVFSYRKKRARDICLDPESLSRVLEAAQKLETTSDQRMKALDGCLKKLTVKQRRLIQYRYSEGFNCAAIAERMNSPISTIYKTIARLHASLQDCVRRTLVVWEAEA